MDPQGVTLARVFRDGYRLNDDGVLRTLMNFSRGALTYFTAWEGRAEGGGFAMTVILSGLSLALGAWGGPRKAPA